MSVIVKGMKMPECCDVCMFSDWSNLSQTASCKLNYYEPCFADFSREYISKRAGFCPIVALPDKHGRLVDADALHTLFENQWHYLQCLNWDENPKAESMQTGINWCINTMHDDAPTIIEAEGDEE